MNRRTALQTAAVGLTAGLAGCATFEGPFEEESTEPGSEEEATETEEEATESETPEPDDPNETNMTDDTDETETDADTIDSDRVAGASFTHTGECSDPETATVEFLDSGVEVLITGCIQARNGCSVPILLGGSEDTGTLRVEIGEADFSDPDTVCTEAIVDQGYELRLRFDPELPQTIEVFHDGAIESGVVATASP